MHRLKTVCTCFAFALRSGTPWRFRLGFSTDNPTPSDGAAAHGSNRPPTTRPSPPMATTTTDPMGPRCTVQVDGGISIVTFVRQREKKHDNQNVLKIDQYFLKFLGYSRMF